MVTVSNRSGSWINRDLGRKLDVSTLCDDGGNSPQKALGSNSHRYGFDRIKLGLRNSESDFNDISYFSIRFQIYLI